MLKIFATSKPNFIIKHIESVRISPYLMSVAWSCLSTSLFRSFAGNSASSGSCTPLNLLSTSLASDVIQECLNKSCTVSCTLSSLLILLSSFAASSECLKKNHALPLTLTLTPTTLKQARYYYLTRNRLKLLKLTTQANN